MGYTDKIVLHLERPLLTFKNLSDVDLVLIKEEYITNVLLDSLNESKFKLGLIEDIQEDETFLTYTYKLNKEERILKVLNKKGLTSLEIARISDQEAHKVLGLVDDLKGNYEAFKNSLLDGLLVKDTFLLHKALEVSNNYFLNPKKYDLFIVDFDGSIIDSMKMWETVCKEYLEAHKIKVTDAFFRRIFASTNHEIACLLQEEYFKEMSVKEVEQSLYDFIGTKYEDCLLKPKAKKLLKTLNQAGKVILYSATALPLLEKLVKKHGIEDLFEGVYSGSEMGLTKADGSGFTYFKEKYHALNPLIVEDALHAIDGAKQQNFDILAISDYGNKEDFQEIIRKVDYFISLNK